MAKWWTCVLVALLALSGYGERERLSASSDRDAFAAFHASRPIALAKRTSGVTRDARTPSKSGHAPAIARQRFTYTGPHLVLLGESAGHPGSDLGQSAAARHGARAPPRV